MLSPKGYRLKISPLKEKMRLVLICPYLRKFDLIFFADCQTSRFYILSHFSIFLFLPIFHRENQMIQPSCLIIPFLDMFILDPEGNRGEVVA